MSQTERTGKLVPQPGGYLAFYPSPLPPTPPLSLDDETMAILSKADRCLGRLDGITQTLPNPELFVAMYVKKEAVLSSQIEGTQASLIDVLEASDDVEEHADPRGVREVVNYVRAMEYGLERLATLPLSLRLLREIHEVLLSGTRGSERAPGEFRRIQNWIGPEGCNLGNAIFVPPPVPIMHSALDDLEKYFRVDSATSVPLVSIGLIHAQFETIHPFLDGNGRMGRLLIAFWLCQQNILSRPLLYLSHYFKLHRQEYYDRLMSVRLQGDWEGWLQFFLRGIAEVSLEATETAKKILKLREEQISVLKANGASANALKLYDLLFEHPVMTANRSKELLEVSFPTANNLLNSFADLGILKPTNPAAQRNRTYRFDGYVKLMDHD